MADKTLNTYGKGFAVTPHDTNDLANPCDALYVGTGGAALKVDTAGGDTVVFGNVVSGDLIPVRVTRVYNTGTGCSNIVALYNQVV